jgi:hypothetical protein
MLSTRNIASPPVSGTNSNPVDSQQTQQNKKPDTRPQTDSSAVSSERVRLQEGLAAQAQGSTSSSRGGAAFAVSTATSSTPHGGDASARPPLPPKSARRMQLARDEAQQGGLAGLPQTTAVSATPPPVPPKSPLRAQLARDPAPQPPRAPQERPQTSQASRASTSQPANHTESPRSIRPATPKPLLSRTRPPKIPASNCRPSANDWGNLSIATSRAFRCSKPTSCARVHPWRLRSASARTPRQARWRGHWWAAA